MMSRDVRLVYRHLLFNKKINIKTKIEETVYGWRQAFLFTDLIHKYYAGNKL